MGTGWPDPLRTLPCERAQSDLPGATVLWPRKSGSGQLWDQQVKDLDEDGEEPEARLVLDAGWGLAALSGRGLLTPYSGLELSEGGSRTYRLGSRVAIDSVFNIDLAANRTEDGGRPEHGIGLQFGMQW